MRKFTLSGIVGVGALLLASGILYAFSPMTGGRPTSVKMNQSSVLRTGPIYTPTSAVIFTDDMDGVNDTTTLAARGYKTYYRGGGTQAGPTWYQGDINSFAAYNGPADGYVAADYQVVSGSNPIDSWLVLPELDIEAGDTLSFFCQSNTGSTYPDSVRVMYSAAGDSVPEATTWVDLGYFKVNTAGVWEWKYFVAPASGMTARFAIRHQLVDAGPFGNSSDYIGIDAINVVEGPAAPVVCSVTTQPTAADVDICGAGTATLTGTAGDPGSTLVWMNSTMQVIGTGSPLDVDASASTTFNAHDAVLDGAGVHLGPTTSIATGAFPSGNFTNGLFITALDYIHVDSITLKTNGTLAGNFQLWTNSPALGGVLLQIAPWSVTGAADHQVAVGLYIAPGTYYINNTYTSGAGILHRNTTGAVYPYTAPGLLSITGSNATNPAVYYYFYEWVVTKVCVGPATPVAVTVNSAAATALPFSEDFETGLPCNWSYSQAAGSQGWLLGDAASTSSSFWTVPAHTNFIASNDDACDCDMSEDRIISPSFNWSSYNSASIITLDFEAFYNGDYQSIATVEVSIDGGATWTQVDSLPDVAGVWQSRSVDLSAYAGESDVMIAWKHDDNGAWASGFAIDDVMITESCGGIPLTIDIVTDIYGSETTWVLYDATSGSTLATGGPYADVTPYNAAAATYQAVVCVPDGASLVFRINDAWGDGLYDGTNTGTFALSLPCQANFFMGSGAFPYGGIGAPPVESWDSTAFTVTTAPPVAGFSLVQANEVLTLTNTSTGVASYAWDFGDGNTSTATSPNYTYTTNGTFTVTLTATNTCGSTTSTQSVTVVGLACSDVPLTIDIITDVYGDETTWVVYNAATGAVLGSGGPYAEINPYNVAAATYQEEVCIPAGTSVVFRINDAWGDGLFDGTNTGSFALSIPCAANFFTSAANGSFPYGGGTPAPIPSWDSTTFVATTAAPVAGFSFTQAAATITTTNTTTGYAQYSWNFGDGTNSTAASPAHTYTANGTYTVTLTSTNLCGSTVSTSSVTITGVGIQEAGAQAMSIHPNPAFDNVQITLGGFNGMDVEIRVMNAIGQEIFAESIRQAGTNVQRNVDLSNVRKGVYFVTVKSADKLMTQKLIVK